MNDLMTERTLAQMHRLAAPHFRAERTAEEGRGQTAV